MQERAIPHFLTLSFSPTPSLVSSLIFALNISYFIDLERTRVSVLRLLRISIINKLLFFQAEMLFPLLLFSFHFFFCLITLESLDFLSHTHILFVIFALRTSNRAIHRLANERSAQNEGKSWSIPHWFDHSARRMQGIHQSKIMTYD